MITPSGLTDTSGTGLADVNPFRYRGYYYDSETGYYYLNSRYYDPETGRFLNADDPAYIGDSGIEGNLYAYCGNNAVNDSDPSPCLVPVSCRPLRLISVFFRPDTKGRSGQ